MRLTFAIFIKGVLGGVVVATLLAGVAAVLASVWRPNATPFVFLVVWVGYAWISGKIAVLKANPTTGDPKRPSKKMLGWNPHKHSDDENVRWSWMRAVEWISWPAFVSQPIMPVLFWLYPTQWGGLLLVLVAFNFLWQYGISAERVSVPLASLGCLFVRLKWIACPVAAYFLWSSDFPYQAFAALLWPVAVYAFASIRIVRIDIGAVQDRFMLRLGYTTRGAQNH